MAINGNVNCQNYHFGSSEQLYQVQKRPLHSPKVTVWFAVSPFKVLRPIFFEDDNDNTVTITTEIYRDTIINLRSKIEVLELEEQDNSASHTARISMETLPDIFPRRFISRFGDVN